MIEVVMQGATNRRKKVLPIWYDVLARYKNSETAQEIADVHGKSRSWVYWVLARFKADEV